MTVAEPRPVRYRVELFGLLEVASSPGVKVRLLELSENGAFIERTQEMDDLQEDDPVSVTLAFPGIGKWTARARICRLGNSRLELKRPKAAHVTVVRDGYGMRFETLTDEALEQLRDFLELLDQR